MRLHQSVATAVLLGVLGFELIVLFVLVFFPYIPDPGLAALNNNIYNFLAPLSTIFLLGLLYCWLIRFGIKEARHKSAKFDSFILFLAEPFQKIVASVKTTS